VAGGFCFVWGPAFRIGGVTKPLTKAHKQTVQVSYIEMWPDHEPRASDPNYHIFTETKARLKRTGLLKCQVPADDHWGNIELHHDKVEFAHANDIDPAKFELIWGLHMNMSEDEFQKYIEGPGNLEPLCTLHHRGPLGVHSLPAPQWNVMRASRNPGAVFFVERNTGIGVQKH
jgi:hypothetical protein